jgi:hypothetical protein
VNIGGGQMATLNEFYLTEDSGGQDGMPASLNDQGDLVFSAVFVPTQGGAGYFKTRITAGCYANCDGSTATPVLNMADFACFLNRFATGDLRANCDLSGVAPWLNALDFTCFLNRLAAGCP